MNQAILDWIENRQRGKMGIYPYRLAMSVCVVFGIPMDEAVEHVLEHVRQSIAHSKEQGHINTKFD